MNNIIWREGVNEQTEIFMEDKGTNIVVCQPEQFCSSVKSMQS